MQPILADANLRIGYLGIAFGANLTIKLVSVTTFRNLVNALNFFIQN